VIPKLVDLVVKRLEKGHLARFSLMVGVARLLAKLPVYCGW
jgi:hypothetical protein